MALKLTFEIVVRAVTLHNLIKFRDSEYNILEKI